MTTGPNGNADIMDLTAWDGTTAPAQSSRKRRAKGVVVDLLDTDFAAVEDTVTLMDGHGSDDDYHFIDEDTDIAVAAAAVSGPSPPRRKKAKRDSLLIQLMDMFPLADPDFLAAQLAEQRTTVTATASADIYNSACLHATVNAIFDLGDDYPKRKADPSAASSSLNNKPKSAASTANTVDYSAATEKRAKSLPASYFACCFEALKYQFDDIPLTFIKSTWTQLHRLLSPTWLALQQFASQPPPRLYTTLKQRRTLPLEWPQRTHDFACVQFLRDKLHLHSAEFADEAQWLSQYLVQQQEKRDTELAKELNYTEYEANAALMECGCCFGDFPFEDMAQCGEGHLFCRDCVRRSVEGLLGMRKVDFKCMSSGEQCDSVFPLQVLQRVLSEQSLKLLDRLIQETNIEKAMANAAAAATANSTDLSTPTPATQAMFVTCPFCQFGAMMESTPDENILFQCLHPDCGVQSCRKCLKPSHIPKSCQEVNRDKVESLQHKLEEAMTDALLRSCPKCAKKFYKEDGCNKMTCPGCSTHICYVCREVVAGYEHFDGRAAADAAANPRSKCPLWDNSVERNAKEVLEAANAVADQLKATVGEAETEKDAAVVTKQLEEARLALAKGLDTVKPKTGPAAQAQQRPAVHQGQLNGVGLGMAHIGPYARVQQRILGAQQSRPAPRRQPRQPRRK